MSSSFGQTDLTAAQPYWYERIPYAFSASNLAASGAVPIFAVQGWNGGGAPSTLVSLREVTVDPWPGVIAQITADTQTYRPYVDSLAHQRPAHGAWAAVRNLSFQLSNQTATVLPPAGLAIPVLRGRYQVAIWQMPAFERLLRGTGLSPTDTAYLDALGFGTDANNQKGWYPTPISAVIERTYANRQIAPPIAWAQGVTATAQSSTVLTLTARPNQLLVLRELAAVAPPEAGVTLTVDRDNDAGHVVLPADQVGRDGVDCFVPALQHLTFKIQAQNPPASRVPLRLTVWVLSLSNILRARLGLLTEAGLQRLLGTSAGTKFWEDVQVGVN